ncbi:MAG: SGNH/GDSL hydrolase family protein [Cyanobacteriota bacterium]
MNWEGLMRAIAQGEPVGLLLIGLLLLLELGLRALGLGNPPLYVADPEAGYRLRPNQRLRRWGKRMVINQHSLRNAGKMPQAGWRVLLLGDSIVHGGTWTDQSQTISEQVRQFLTPRLGGAGMVLNAAAPSWGPQNQWGYLQQFGTFEAQVVVLLLNTDDLFAPPPTDWPVGRDRQYPRYRPPLALWEALSLLMSRPAQRPTTRPPSGDPVADNLLTIEQMRQFVMPQAQFLVALSPLRRELKQPGPRDYERVARQRLRELLQRGGVPFLDLLPRWNALRNPEALYRDGIHPSPAGNAQISQAIAEFILHHAQRQLSQHLSRH